MSSPSETHPTAPDNHFDTIADVFNRIWYFSEAYAEFIITHILQDLELRSEDTLVDIGGGTGTFTRRILDEAGAEKAYCVEPSRPMCDEASKIGKITALCMDAHSFLSAHIPFSKLLFKEVIHHIDDRRRLWKNVYDQLPENGRLLIITRPQTVSFPLFSSAKAAFARHQPPHPLLEAELKECGFKILSEQRSHTFTLPKERWYEMLRYRFMSDLRVFSDEEIEAGIDELETIYPDPTIEIVDDLIFIVAMKRLS